MIQTGTLKWFDHAKGYGFILDGGGGPDIYVHASEVSNRNILDDLRTGMPLQFTVEPGRGNRPMAKFVKPA
jgi:cold shock protein